MCHLADMIPDESHHKSPFHGKLFRLPRKQELDSVPAQRLSQQKVGLWGQGNESQSAPQLCALKWVGCWVGREVTTYQSLDSVLMIFSVFLRQDSFSGFAHKFLVNVHEPTPFHQNTPALPGTCSQTNICLKRRATQLWVYEWVSEWVSKWVVRI